MKPTLVIGDCHGHYDRLEALLIQEGILGECPACDSMGAHDCPTCDGDGIARINYDVEVVQLGDFGHWGAHNGSPTGDILTTKACIAWCDVMLWGNHDRALIDSAHDFRGYTKPSAEAYHLIKLAQAERKLRLAHSSHGYLFTHAGLHYAFSKQDLPQYLKDDADVFAAWLNINDTLWLEGHQEAVSPQFVGIRDAVSRQRGGSSHNGGIIWRDVTEKLYMGFPQVFGHSADPQHLVRICAQKDFYRTARSSGEDIYHGPSRLSYCIDVGGKGGIPGDHCLAGIWLPSEEIVRVDL